CTIRFAVYAEPKVKMLKGYYNAHVTLADDELGNSLLATTLAQNPPRAQAVATWLWPMTSAYLTPPMNAGSSIAHLKGTLPLVIQSKSVSIELSDILRSVGVTKSADRYSLHLKDIRKSAQTYILTLQVTYKDGAPTLWNDINFGSTFRLL